MMNKEELIAEVMAKLEDMGFPFPSKAQARRTVNAVFDAIRESVTDGDGVNVSGFGSFHNVERKATKCRNMHTGEIMDIPARRGVKFTPSKAFRDGLNG